LVKRDHPNPIEFGLIDRSLGTSEEGFGLALSHPFELVVTVDFDERLSRKFEPRLLGLPGEIPHR